MYAIAQQMLDPAQSGEISSPPFEPGVFADPGLMKDLSEGERRKKGPRRAAVPKSPGISTVSSVEAGSGPEIQANFRDDQYFSGCPPAMPVGRTAAAQAHQHQPSSVSIGKKPMAYPPPSSQPATPTTATPTTTTATTTTRSARAQSKAPLAYPPQQQQQPPQAQQQPHTHPHHHPSPPSSNASAPHKSRPPQGAGSDKGKGTATNPPQHNNKIWSTSTIEERERIKDFWLGLGEEERRNLVKIEKDTVLRKMKEQQKHSCSCAVCGRKRFVSFSVSLPFQQKI